VASLAPTRAHEIQSEKGNPHWTRLVSESALDHIPGEDGWPLVGTTFQQLADPIGFGQRMQARHGPVFRTRSFGRRQVTLIGPDANELVLFDRDKLFSSEQGWGPVLNLLFPRGLMLMDFAGHRADRRRHDGSTAAERLAQVAVEHGHRLARHPLSAPLELEQTFTMTLTFEQAGDVEVQVTVRDDAP
jgi:hypothetical protein